MTNIKSFKLRYKNFLFKKKLKFVFVSIFAGQKQIVIKIDRLYIYINYQTFLTFFLFYIFFIFFTAPMDDSSLFLYQYISSQIYSQSVQTPDQLSDSISNYFSFVAFNIVISIVIQDVPEIGCSKSNDDINKYIRPSKIQVLGFNNNFSEHIQGIVGLKIFDFNSILNFTCQEKDKTKRERKCKILIIRIKISLILEHCPQIQSLVCSQKRQRLPHTVKVSHEEINTFFREVYLRAFFSL